MFGLVFILIHIRAPIITKVGDLGDQGMPCSGGFQKVAALTTAKYVRAGFNGRYTVQPASREIDT